MKTMNSDCRLKNENHLISSDKKAIYSHIHAHTFYFLGIH